MTSGTSKIPLIWNTISQAAGSVGLISHDVKAHVIATLVYTYNWFYWFNYGITMVDDTYSHGITMVHDTYYNYTYTPTTMV